MKPLLAALGLLIVNLLWVGGAAAQNAPAQEVLAALPQETEQLEATSETVVDYKLLLSAAEKVGRDLRFDRATSVSGDRTRTLWKLPKGAVLDDVFDTATAQLEGEVLFRCTGRGCGRSTAWANLVFSEALLYGQDRYQRRIVFQTSPDEYQSLYAIRRGNQRVHLLHELVSTNPTAAVNSSYTKTAPQISSSASAELARLGYAQLSAVPGVDGALDAATLDLLKQAGAELEDLGAGEIHVVCHLYGTAAAQTLIEQSIDCAASARDALQEGYLGARPTPSGSREQTSRTTFVGFGAGPLLPRLGGDNPTGKPLVNRLELVAPARLRKP